MVVRRVDQPPPAPHSVDDVANCLNLPRPTPTVVTQSEAAHVLLKQLYALPSALSPSELHTRGRCRSSALTPEVMPAPTVSPHQPPLELACTPPASADEPLITVTRMGPALVTQTAAQTPAGTFRFLSPSIRLPALPGAPHNQPPGVPAVYVVPQSRCACRL